LLTAEAAEYAEYAEKGHGLFFVSLTRNASFLGVLGGLGG
jgi:hypothetical protein